MALYWLPKKLTKEKDLGGWKIPIFHCRGLPAQKSNRVYFFNCSNQDVVDLSPNVLKNTFTPVSWKQRPQRRWPEGNYNEYKSLLRKAVLAHSCGLDQLPEIRVKETGWSIIGLFCWSPNSSNSTSDCVRKTNRDNGIFTLLSSLSRSIRERLLLRCGRSEP